MEYKILETKFVGGFNLISKFPNDLPHIALLGRSNSGKSTLVNKLCARKRLAITSKTPGRTQEFNFFKITYEIEDKKNSFYLVDLPGFGFAKFSKSMQTALSKNIVKYLSSDAPLTSVLLLNDARRTPKEDEFAIQKMCFENNIFFQVVLTKVDKLKKNDIKKQKEAISKCYNLEPNDLVLSGDGIPASNILERIFELCQD